MCTGTGQSQIITKIITDPVFKRLKSILSLFRIRKKPKANTRADWFKTVFL